MTYPLLFLLSISLSFAQNSSENGFITANNRLSCDIYKTLSKTSSGNFLVSPFAVDALLGLLLLGAEGQTAEEIRQTLHFSEEINEEEAIQFFASKWFRYHHFYLFSANKMYAQKNVSLEECFKVYFTFEYHNNIELITFAKNVEAANIINTWVQQRTNRRIKDIIDSNKLSSLTKAVLINAVYFNATWTISFKESRKRLNFYRTETDVVKVDSLYHRNIKFGYYRYPGGEQVLELPMQKGAFMYIILPGRKNGLKEMEQSLKDRWVVPEITSTLLNVKIPKFKIKSIIDLKNVLEKHGVKKLFKKNEAELDGLAKGEDLYINHMIQGTYIDVNKDGTEATAGVVEDAGIPTSKSSLTLTKPIDFVANYPFIFFIKVDGLDIFAGRVTDPSC